MTNQSEQLHHISSLSPKPSSLAVAVVLTWQITLPPKQQPHVLWDGVPRYTFSVISWNRDMFQSSLHFYRKNAHLSTELEAACRTVIHQGGHRPHSQSSWPCQSLENTVYSVSNAGYQAQDIETTFKKEQGINHIPTGTTSWKQSLLSSPKWFL